MNTARDLFTKVLTRARDSTKQKSGLFGLLSENTITVTNLLFSAVVVGLQQLLNSEVFDCPLNNHVPYGIMFLVFPFFIVLIMNILLIGKVWKITDWCMVPSYRGRRCEVCLWLTPNICKAFVGPFVWLIASLQDGKYVACVAVGQDIEKRNLTDVTEIKKLEEEFADAKTWSVISAWIVFLVFVLATAVMMTTKKCCHKENVLLEDEYILHRREAIAALLTFRHFIEHPKEHGDGETEPNKDDKKAQPSGSNQPVSETKSIATNTAPGNGSTHGAASPKDDPRAGEPGHGPSESDVIDGIDKESIPEKDKKKDEKETEQASLWGRIVRWFTGDKQKDKENDEEQGIIGRFFGKEEEITLYPEGIPEQIGKKNVEKLFQGWSSKDVSWHYHKAYEQFKKKYPRVTTGNPRDPWVTYQVKQKGSPKKGGILYSSISADDEAMSSL